MPFLISSAISLMFETNIITKLTSAMLRLRWQLYLVERAIKYCRTAHRYFNKVTSVDGESIEPAVNVSYPIPDSQPASFHSYATCDRT